ncbi:MAG: methyltransferase domain-containing protein [Thermodesulfobacteriota bacterium]|nr:methyltransferase domain-containing protein [Thermodesulfobacteriota bacterium]
MREAIVDYIKWAIERFPYEEPILDTCAGWEPNYYQPLFPGKRYIKQDMQDFDPPCIDILCDITDMKPVSDESIGLALNLESLEHIPYPQKAIDEIHRILRPKGLLILTTVMHFKIHHAPKDYWRFTPEGIEFLLKRFKILDCALEGDSKRPKGIWVTAQKTSHLEEWGKLPPLRVARSDDRVLKKLERRIKRLFFSSNLKV